MIGWVNSLKHTRMYTCSGPGSSPLKTLLLLVSIVFRRVRRSRYEMMRAGGSAGWVYGGFSGGEGVWCVFLWVCVCV
jgi:hypothetical protein